MVPTAPGASDATPRSMPTRSARNAQLGTYTNFVNLLGWCALALPAGMHRGRPAVRRHLHRAAAQPMPRWPRFGQRWQAQPGAAARRDAGAAASRAADAVRPAPPASAPTLPIAVVGAHLSGLPLNGQLHRARRARLREATRTAPRYRLFALPGTTPPKPGLLRVRRRAARRSRSRSGTMPIAQVGSFLALDPAAARPRHASSWPTAAGCTASSAKRMRSPARATSRSSAAGAPIIASRSRVRRDRRRTRDRKPSRLHHPEIRHDLTHRPRAPDSRHRPAPPHRSSSVPRSVPRIAALGVPALVRAQAAPKIRIGYWPVAAGLPFFAAVEKGYFKEAGPRRRAAQVRRRAAGDGSDAVGPLRRQRQRHRLGQPRDRRDRAAGPVQDLRDQPEQREVRARGVPGAQGQPGQDDGRAEGQARRLRPRHPERDARQDDARARRRRRDERHRAADRPARGGARRRPDRRRLHARADRHRSAA